MVFVLILMIKNESRILQRCLQAVENVVDYFCILDTGSTDNSVEIANDFLKTHKGCVTSDPFKDFGYSRTKSFENAQKYLLNEGVDITKVYGLLLDADMVFVPGTLKQQNLTAVGYKIIQLNGNLEYYNCRIIRMDFPWKCVGVTHEYWAGPTDNLEKNVCYIDDKNDGGCKHDKFERDAKLLEKGLEENPTDVRYMFYLAQTYKCVGRSKDAIKMYKKRIAAGGWAEEIWHSHYSIGECYRNLKDLFKFEEWMQKAFAYRSCRTESLYQLSKTFRELGQHYKSYHYLKIGQQIPFPKDDSLFIESNVYKGWFDYESSIVEYYIHPEKCLRTTIGYMLKLGDYQQNCVSNLKFSVKPVKCTMQKLNLPLPFGDHFNPSAISICEYPMANIRYINYLPPTNGSYATRDGSPIQTKNAYVNLETQEYTSMIDIETPFNSQVKGLEDLRLYKHDNKLLFTATSFKEFIENKVGIVHGEYDLENKTYKNCKGIISPTNSDCEKNWVNIEGTEEFIYGWNPLKIGKIRGDKFYFNKNYNVPPLFSLFRGSCPAIKWKDDFLVLVHFVEYSIPRKYYHCFVRLSQNYQPLEVSLPFCFKTNAIEYCVSTLNINNTFIDCYISLNDTDPQKCTIAYKDLEWVEVAKQEVKNNIITLTPNNKTYWDGQYSKCLANNEIERYVNKSINSQKLDIKVAFSTTDGILGTEEYDRLFNEFGKIPGKLGKYKDYPNNKKIIICALCTRYVNESNILMLPFDDETFKIGLSNVLKKFNMPNWETKQPIVFWRGGSSGYDKPLTIRMKVVAKLLNNSNSDVKLTKWGNWESEHNVPENYFGDRCDLNKHLKYKYILILDGACIASNHQWVFGSGSVPVMITHPSNNWWFKQYLVPMKHYVPISYDLSDLEEKLQWLVDNDEKAKEIAEDAFKFSNETFNSDFQQTYIDKELKRLSQDLN